jgi:hypothetical protein
MIKFIGQNDEWITSMKRLFQKVPNVCVDKVDIRSIPRDGACFVIPTNSFGLINDEYDYIVRDKVFPGINTTIKKRINDAPIPVGSAITIPYRSSYIMIAPPSIATEDTSSTDNAYLSFLVTLRMWEKLYKDTGKWYNLIVTQHCHDMSGNISAEQMKMAYDDYIGRNYEESNAIIKRD